MRKLKLLFSLLLMALVTSVGSSQSITTLFAGGNNGASGWAVMYDATIGPADLDIISFEVNATSAAGTAFTLDFYTTPGGFAGNELNAAAWTLVGTGSGTAAGAGLPSLVTLATPVTVTTGTTLGFAVVLTGAGPAYTNGDGTNQAFSNADISLALGSSVSGAFTGTIFNPRVWNGTINYELVAPPPCPTVATPGCPAEAYAINNNNGEFVSVDPITGNQTVIAPLSSPNGGFMAGGEVIDGIYYFTSNGDIFSVNLITGEVCDVPVVAGCGGSVTSLEVDPTTGILYGLGVNCSVSTTLIEIDLAAGTCTPIGVIPGVTCGISLVIDDAGNAMVIDIIGDDITPIDLATGATTGPGIPLGIDLNFGQDYDFDCPSGGIIFGFAFNNVTFTMQYVSIDPITGTTTVIQDFGFSQTGSFAFCSVAVGCDIVCPANISVPCEGGADPAITGMATSGADCVIAFTDMMVDCQISRTWTSTAPSGQITSCVQIITLVDDIAPTVSCPPNMGLTCFENIPSPLTNIADFIDAGGAASDNCDLRDAIFSQDSSNGADNCPGNAVVVTRTYFITDVCGNITTCDQTFTYTASAQGPVITSILPTCFKYCADFANPMESDVTFTTDCSFDAMVNIDGPVQIGDDNCPGTIYRYTYTVEDDCGRISAPVNRDFIIGNDGPTIECPAFNLLLECGDPNNMDYIAAHAALVTANSSCELGITITQLPANFNNITCNTSTVVMFTAADDCGRTAPCTTTINISDNTAPVITSTYVDGICNEAVCGSNLTFWFNEWKDKVLEGLTATDDCDSNVTFTTSGPNSPNQNCPDETTETVIAFVANDNCGNTSSIEYSFFVTALDTPEPPQTSSITGMINTESMVAVEDVEVYLSGGANFFEQFVTSNDGNYAFDNVPLEQNYSITPLHNQFPMNGVSSYDLILMAQHILDISQLDSPYKMIAADVNASGSITTIDLVELRKMILYINTAFPDNTSWRFVDANFVFPDVENPFATAFPEIVTINGLLESLAQDFVGVKTGDVNESAVPNNLAGADDRSFNGELNFNVKDHMLKAGETHEVVFSANDFEAIAGYQYTLNFNTDLLEFVNVTAGELAGVNESSFGLSLLNEGAITTSWTNDAPISMRADADLFRITFKAKSATQLSEALSINSRYTAAEAYDVSTENGQLNLLNVNLRFEDAAGISAPFALLQNTPNPFRDETVIGFVLPAATSATLTIYDVSGKQVKLISGDYEAGYNEINLNRADLANGMLYYQLETTTDTATRKMFLIK